VKATVATEANAIRLNQDDMKLSPVVVLGSQKVRPA
jgi:hypothetical protein